MRLGARNDAALPTQRCRSFIVHGRISSTQEHWQALHNSRLAALGRGLLKNLSIRKQRLAPAFPRSLVQARCLNSCLASMARNASRRIGPGDQITEVAEGTALGSGFRLPLLLVPHVRRGGGLYRRGRR